MTDRQEQLLRWVAADLRTGRLSPDQVAIFRDKIERFREQLLDQLGRLEETRARADSARLSKEYLAQKLEDALNDLRRNQSPVFIPFKEWVEAAKHAVDQINLSNAETRITDLAVHLVAEVGIMNEVLACLDRGDNAGAADRIDQYLDLVKSGRKS